MLFSYGKYLLLGGGNGVGGSWGGQGPPAREQWHNESPTIQRRMDDGGTSIWGKGDVRGGAPGGRHSFLFLSFLPIGSFYSHIHLYYVVSFSHVIL